MSLFKTKKKNTNKIKICKLTRSPILNERTSCTEPMPWLPRDRVVPGELVNIIVLMSGFVNVVDMPNKTKGRLTDRFLLQFFTLPAVKLGIAGGQNRFAIVMLSPVEVESLREHHRLQVFILFFLPESLLLQQGHQRISLLDYL